MDENRKELLEMSMGKLFIKLAIPAMIGMIAVGLYNMIDAIFVGQLVSAEGVGAIVLGYNIILLNLAVSMLLAMGAMSVLSRAIGENDKETIDKLFGNVLIGVSVLSILLTIVVYNFANPMLQFIGAEGEILDLGVRYLKIISLGFIFSGLGPALNFLIRGEGQMKRAMQIITLGIIINIILDPILIRGFDMGIEGAALATIISQVFVVIGDIMYFQLGKSVIKLSKNSFKMSFDIMPKILNVGISGLVMQIMPAIQMSIMFKVLSSYGGNDSVVIMSASYRVMMFAFISLWGIAQGIQPIIGANYGANQFQRVKEAFLTYTKISTGVAGVLWVSFMVIPKTILSWFITDASLVQLGIGRFRVFLGIFILYGIMSISIVFFQGIGKGSKAAILVMGRQILFFIPIILFLPRLIGETGAWIAMPLGDLLTILLSIFLVIKEFAILNNRIKGYRDDILVK
ncbi:MATE family efflux transporter [Clostridiisalibacter paucivorans]|uniref:MATE family efflux transporter n=1 Tax=Clostridiisalibacter paucivorans TaxID=408753 RepID=UPI00047DBE3D|nr:MATE family efflux transporter [Clostridiisalibacter paucivorans]